jgi:hypothetical protein
VSNIAHLQEIVMIMTKEEIDAAMVDEYLSEVQYHEEEVALSQEEYLESMPF